MKKSIVKFLAVFSITFLIGLWSGGFFERYVVNFNFVPNFSVSEAKNLKGKTIKQTCGSNKGRSGKVTTFSRGEYGLIRVRIVWENSETENRLEIPKGCFSKCYEVAE